MRPNRIRPPQGATFVISLLGVAILAVLIGYNIGNWALGLLLSPGNDLQTSSSLGDTTSNYTYIAAGNNDTSDNSSTGTQSQQSQDQQSQGQQGQNQQSQPQTTTSTDVVVRGPSVTGNVELYKVRVGDFFTREDAISVRDELKAMGYNDSYVPPVEDGAYAVQVGAFGSSANANSLAQALLSKGFDVYIIEQVKQ